jgi:hypothetical protein
MSVVRLLVAVVVTVTGLVLAPTPAYACSCARPSTAEQVAMADVVVRGVVVDPPRATGLDGALPGALDPARFTLRVTEVYRGPDTSTVEVWTAASSVSCGLEGLRSGQEYVVFAAAEGAEDALWANLCGGTAPASPRLVEAVEAVEAVEKAATDPPRTEPSRADLTPVAQPTADASPLMPVSLLGGAGVVLAALGGLFVRLARRG